MKVEIIGTGSCVPELKVPNADFVNHDFYNKDGSKIEQEGEVIISKFQDITGIAERRYAKENQVTSTLGAIAGKKAVEDAAIDPETLDGVIVAHNFGDVDHGHMQSDILPSLATRIKHELGIKNENCIAFDILYGCPGWVQCLITAYSYMAAGMGKRYLVIGAETLSRKIDQYDRDCMIFSDGAGACVVQANENLAEGKGILSMASQTFTTDEAFYLHYSESNNPNHEPGRKFIKMEGRKIYEFALSKVPLALKTCLERANLDISDVHKILIHQANEKMDEAIIKRLYRLYKKEMPEDIMPMNIHELGNSSVATVPTLLDQLFKGKLDNHSYQEGDVLLFASVGSGMSINAVAYRI